MPFEDELGEALRRTGDGFTTDGPALVEAGEQHGRRLVARRRAAVVGGSVLALAVIGTAGAYTGGLFGGAGGSGVSGSGSVNVAAPPPLPSGKSGESGGSGGVGGSRQKPGGPRVGTGAVSAAQLVDVLKALLPGGRLSETQARGTGDEPGPMVSGVYDDGKGKAAVGVGLSRVDPDGSNAREMTKCGDKELLDYDSCTSEKLADGSQLLLYQGYEYPDRRAETKVWRATLVTPQGFMVDASEWNAPAEKGKPVSRPTPPLTLAQMRTLVTSDTWHPALNDLPAASPERQAAAPPASVPDASGVLQSLLPKSGNTVVTKGGEGDYGYAVLDDGKGKSLIQVNVQANMGDLLQGHMSGSGSTTLPDGTLVKLEQKPGEKGGANVVWWTVDTLRPDGRRVVVSAFNTGNQNKPATREKPILTMEQLKAIALDPKWLG
ncbi:MULTISPECIES: hypothetical protein [unclassified Streptomyces]|uniref:hypothetical protein n=1 Tax=unclassified Streptomyces TaxID=2593676 RepID=UPI001BE6621D|nr:MULTISPECIES: hypothetical protein [unclassified Streptomyces]MBT2403441.1 hypothetical protein [Streptomyces sp. ISL-21]MBT2606972.1 hypothetical protein [Streptomyces sp. ISL-87]